MAECAALIGEAVDHSYREGDWTAVAQAWDHLAKNTWRTDNWPGPTALSRKDSAFAGSITFLNWIALISI
jgi:hypothetical protein